MFCFVWCFVFVYFVFVLFCCFCFVFVCLFVFSIHFKSWNEWCSHTKTSKLLRKWEIQNGGSDLAPQLLGEHIILQVLLDRGHAFFLNYNFFKVTKTMLGVIHKDWGPFFDSPIRLRLIGPIPILVSAIRGGGGSWTKITKSFPVKIEFIYMICHGVDLNFHVKKGRGLKSKYSCAVHSDLYCFASADICQHGLLHVVTCVAYTIYSLTDVQQWSLNAPLRPKKKISLIALSPLKKNGSVGGIFFFFFNFFFFL